MEPNIILQWPSIWSTLFCCVGLFSGLALFISKVQKPLEAANTTENLPKSVSRQDGYPKVEPLPDFDWKTTEPIKIRPFKSKYNLTMSIQEATVNELIEMDKNYLDRIMLRRRLMEEHPNTVLASEHSVKPAVDEFYTWLLSQYLPNRYPSMFRLQSRLGDNVALLRNLVTNEELPLTPSEDSWDTLKILGGLVDDDFLFLMPSEDGDGFTLKGFVTCFPNGFNTSKKLNMKLRDIHKPVPSYKEKLEKSMDRYFQRLQPGKFIKRANWTITTTNQLFTASGNHLYEGEDIPQENIDINMARVRVERQFLHRLAQSGAILFSFKTLLYTLPEIKEEGLGDALADAIDGLNTGNAPGFHFYKRAAVWGESAKDYLKS
ncbi:uncharacterized protein N7469_003874 [Penicillium citrinum]|uniref:DUF3445 domain-containing protein n=1 Tax=Penicillium citrinum TaxID=5077 RepID=A0A9W9P3E4_PENCI|nr:uncharacterized protein N7469_003874 [Penicillium citrinum]KAJ5234706.1 hypothetical protein N7469_003874 [Penicillium citrinum]